jgi:PD-(D/E)XK endonuclease
MDRPVRRARLINRRQQGDLGEASAIEWLTSVGAIVLLPVGHSPDYDLVAELEGKLLRVQVKTSTQSVVTPDGHDRCVASLSIRGGNQSWNRTTKRLDPSRVDYVFVLSGDGRRWFIPANMLEARCAVSLGGTKYSEFEIEPGRPIRRLVYDDDPALESGLRSGEYPSGQRTAPVKRQAHAFAGSNPASPITGPEPNLRQESLPAHPTERVSRKRADFD